MKINTLLSRLFHSRIPLLASVSLITLALSIPVFGGPIHDGTKSRDLAKVKVLFLENPDLVRSKDSDGNTPLHWAVARCRKGVVASAAKKEILINLSQYETTRRIKP
jgi:ankyrin repeat protein